MTSHTKGFTNHRHVGAVQTALLLAVALVGAVGCSPDSRVTGPLKTVHLPGKLRYDSVASPEAKNVANLRRLGGASAVKLTARKLDASASVSAAEDPSAIVATEIPFRPEPGPFMNVMPACDDCLLGETDADGYPILGPDGVWLGLPLGFNFTFYGKTYDRYYYSTNGFITFDFWNNGCCDGGALPYAGIHPQQQEPVNNVIAFAWADLNPTEYQVTYDTRGTPGNRRFILNLENVVYTSEPDARVTTQLILYEGSNAVEIHTLRKDRNLWQMTTQGIENADGTLAAYLPTRVEDYFELNRDAVRFAAPSGANRAPSVDAGGNAGDPVDHYEAAEGQLLTFKATGVDADNDALSYAWDFDGDGAADRQGAVVEYVYTDNGKFAATVTVDDGKGGTATASAPVLVRNVAPTGVLSAPEGGVDEGSPIVLSASDVADPSASDLAAGFEFAFDCGNGYGAFSRASTATCATLDNGVRTVGVRIRDKDGGEQDKPFTKLVGVHNVAPAVGVAQGLSAKSGQLVSLSGQFSDVGANDRVWKWKWSSPANANIAVQGVVNSGPVLSQGQSSEQGAVGGLYRACAAGPQDVTLEVWDKDGGRGAATVTINVEASRAEMKVKPSGVALRANDFDDDNDDNDDDRWADEHGRLVTVYLFSSPGFDATTIDPSSIRLTNGSGKGTPLAVKKKKKGGDEWEMKSAHLDGDRLRDVKLRFSRELLIKNGDLTASTTSLTLAGRSGTCLSVAASASLYVKP